MDPSALLGKFPLILPYGYRDPAGNLVRDFDVLEVDGVFENIFTNRQYAAKRPQRWMARCASAILNTIGTVDVRAQYKKLDCAEHPSMLDSLKLHDMTWILFCGHIKTYGPILEQLKFECPNCTAPNLFTNIDLGKEIKVTFADEPVDEVVVTLPNGWQYKVKNDSVEGVSGHTWNRMTFRLPTLKDAIYNEKHYSAQAIADFNIRIAQSAILKVEAVEFDPFSVLEAKAAEGGFNQKLLKDIGSKTMAEDDLGMVRSHILLDLKGLDRQQLRRQFDKVNVVELEISRDCIKCGADLEINIRPEDLYPLA